MKKQSSRGKSSPSWAFLALYTIPDSYSKNLTYLRRLRIIQTPWFGVYIHWIYLPDRDRDPHDHPWPFLSWVLRGWYNEEITDDPDRPDVKRSKHNGRLSVDIMPLDKAHRIRQLGDGTVTFIVVGRRSRNWGFWTEQGFVPWQDYVSE